jgi:hypothetical protein
MAARTNYEMYDCFFLELTGIEPVASSLRIRFADDDEDLTKAKQP